MPAGGGGGDIRLLCASDGSLGRGPSKPFTVQTPAWKAPPRLSSIVSTKLRRFHSRPSTAAVARMHEMQPTGQCRLSSRGTPVRSPTSSTTWSGARSASAESTRFLPRLSFAPACSSFFPLTPPRRAFLKACMWCGALVAKTAVLPVL